MHLVAGVLDGQHDGDVLVELQRAQKLVGVLVRFGLGPEVFFRLLLEEGLDVLPGIPGDGDLDGHFIVF